MVLPFLLVGLASLIAGVIGGVGVCKAHERLNRDTPERRLADAMRDREKAMQERDELKKKYRNINRRLEEIEKSLQSEIEAEEIKLELLEIENQKIAILKKIAEMESKKRKGGDDGDL